MHIHVETPEWEKLVSKIQQEQELVKLENTNGKFDEETMLLWDGLVGAEIQETKRCVLRIINFFENVKKNANVLQHLNMLFYGAPGTGKTTMAKIVGKLMHAKGILPTETLYIADAFELCSHFVGATASNLYNAIEKAIGGVLLLENVDSIDNENSLNEFVTHLVAATNSYRGKICIILTGYGYGFENFLVRDPILLRNFPGNIHFNNYSIKSLMKILKYLLESKGKLLSKEAEETVEKIILLDMKTKEKNFGNADYLQWSIVARLDVAHTERNQNDNIFSLEDIKMAFPNKIQEISEKDEKSGSATYYKWVYNPTYSEARRRNEQLLEEQSVKLRELLLKDHQEVDTLKIFDKIISEFEEKILSVANSYCCNNTIEQDDCDCVSNKVVALKYHQLLESLVNGFDGKFLENSETVRIKEGLMIAEHSFLSGDYEACVGACQALIPRVLVLHLLNKF